MLTQELTNTQARIKEMLDPTTMRGMLFQSFGFVAGLTLNGQLLPRKYRNLLTVVAGLVRSAVLDGTIDRTLAYSVLNNFDNTYHGSIDHLLTLLEQLTMSAYTLATASAGETLNSMFDLDVATDLCLKAFMHNDLPLLLPDA